MTDPVKNALLSDIKQSLNRAIDDFREVSKAHLSDDGLKYNDCQLVCLLLSADNLEHLINGISVSDLL